MSVACGRVYMILFGTAFLVSCALVFPTGDQFLSARDDFSQRLRWQDYQGAARHFKAEERNVFLKQFSDREELRFVAVEPISADMSDGNRRAETLTALEYYRLPSVVVKRYRLEQEWVFEEKSWKIVSPFPELP